MLFLGFEDVFEQLAAHVIAEPLAIGDPGLEVGNRGHFQAQIAIQRLARALTDQQLAELLQVRQAVEEQDALDEPVGVLHLVDRLLVLVLGEFRVTPVPVHARMQEILIDRGQFVVQRLVEVADDLRIAFHFCSLPVRAQRGTNRL